MEKLIEYEKKLIGAVQEWGEDAIFVFRGHANKEWGLDSGADRRLRELKVKPDLIEYLNKSLLEPARHEGYGRQQNKELDDLELLAALQHNGAATCLIDFTANFHIALWFACQNEDSDGKVFVVNRSDIYTFQEVTPKRANEGIKELLQGSGQHDLVSRQQKVYYWKPPPNENRIITQHSCFLFSPRPIGKEAYREIVISKDHKKEIQVSLQRYYDLDEQTIFRDFTGFARSQAQSQPIKHETSEQWLRSGYRYCQQGEFEAAIEDLDTALRLNSQLAEGYCVRGIAKGSLQRYEDAIADYDTALQINPQLVLAYLGRGIDKKFLGLYAEIFADSDKEFIGRGSVKDDPNTVLQFNPQLTQASRDGELSKSKLAWYEGARADFQHALELATEQGEEELGQLAQERLNQLPSGNSHENTK